MNLEMKEITEKFFQIIKQKKGIEYTFINNDTFSEGFFYEKKEIEFNFELPEKIAFLSLKKTFDVSLKENLIKRMVSFKEEENSIIVNLGKISFNDGIEDIRGFKEYIKENILTIDNLREYFVDKNDLLDFFLFEDNEGFYKKALEIYKKDRQFFIEKVAEHLGDIGDYDGEVMEYFNISDEELNNNYVYYIENFVENNIEFIFNEVLREDIFEKDKNLYDLLIRDYVDYVFYDDKTVDFFEKQIDEQINNDFLTEIEMRFLINEEEHLEIVQTLKKEIIFNDEYLLKKDIKNYAKNLSAQLINLATYSSSTSFWNLITLENLLERNVASNKMTPKELINILDTMAEDKELYKSGYKILAYLESNIPSNKFSSHYLLYVITKEILNNPSHISPLKLYLFNNEEFIEWAKKKFKNFFDYNLLKNIYSLKEFKPFNLSDILIRFRHLSEKKTDELLFKNNYIVFFVNAKLFSDKVKNSLSYIEHNGYLNIEKTLMNKYNTNSIKEVFKKENFKRDFGLSLKSLYEEFKGVKLDDFQKAYFLANSFKVLTDDLNPKNNFFLTRVDISKNIDILYGNPQFLNKIKPVYFDMIASDITPKFAKKEKKQIEREIDGKS